MPFSILAGDINRNAPVLYVATALPYRGSYDIVKVLDGNRAIGKGRVGGALALIQRTGSRVTQGQVTCQIVSLEDTGDRAGTLAVTDRSARTRGKVAAAVFGL